MTKENARKNYKHYRDVGKDDVADQILEKYPELEEHECEECGDTFDSEKGLKIHKKQVHD